MLRTPKERLVQTASYEIGGLIVVVPAYSALFGSPGEMAFGILTVIALEVMIWTPIHNHLFDWYEARRFGGRADQRPAVGRVVHALSLEGSSVMLSTPVLMWAADLAFLEALLIDIGLTLAYAAYAFLFHLGYDAVRPIGPGTGQAAAFGLPSASTKAHAGKGRE